MIYFRRGFRIGPRADNSPFLIFFPIFRSVLILQYNGGQRLNGFFKIRPVFLKKDPIDDSRLGLAGVTCTELRDFGGLVDLAFSVFAGALERVMMGAVAGVFSLAVLPIGDVLSAVFALSTLPGSSFAGMGGAVGVDVDGSVSAAPLDTAWAPGLASGFELRST